MRDVAVKNDGFTLIELIIVIVLLSILSAIALPRFLNLSDKAHDATIEGIASALEAGIHSFKSYTYVKRINNQQLTNISGFADGTADTGSSGQIVGSTDNNNVVGNDHDCRDIFRTVLEMAPLIERADPNKERGAVDLNYIDFRLDEGYEWVAGQDGIIPDATISLPTGHNSQICQYIYLGYNSVAEGSPKKTIFLDTLTGKVYLDLDRVF